MRAKVARPVWANAGTASRYRRQMLLLIDEMARSVEFWLGAQRKATPPVLASDATPSEQMRLEFERISERWQTRFDDMAPKVAETFVKNLFRSTDSAMRQALREAGWSIQFTLTPAMRDAFEASLAENVGLIKSIPAQYLQEVEGIVMRNYAAGRDLKSMAADIRGRYHVAADRAVLIARDQANKGSAIVQRARQLELGIKQSIWMHSHAGKEPRRSHVAMNGKIYEVDKGMYDPDVKAFIFPGQLINCRCTSRSVLPWTPVEGKTQWKEQSTK